MLRGLMVVLALAATAAHAQETKAASSSSDAAPAKAAGERGTVLASRTTPEPRSPPLARNAGSRDTGAAALGEKPEADCSIMQTFRGGGAPAVRTYQAPPPEPQRLQDKAWIQPPYVAAVARCGRLYLLQIWSRSNETWTIERARLEGPRGELLQVTALQFDDLKTGWSSNIIVAAAPPEVQVSKLKLHLTGQDGRVAQPEARELP